jgi:thioesterase domain-containing protein
MILDTVPQTTSGKLDRNALPAPRFEPRPFRAPVTAAERQVAEVFSEVLGGRRVGVDDNFFDLGGNSLIATRVTALLSERFGRRARVQWLFATPTVAGLAALFSGAADTSGGALEVVLPIRATGSGAPLFCLPPMLGLSWSYAVLAEHLPDRPIYGLQTPVAVEPAVPAGSVADLAARYVAAVREVQPHGPYHLLGWSRGGVLAHAVATVLQAAGEPVALLAMLDSTRFTDSARFRSELVAALGEIGITLGPDDDLARLSDEQLATLATAFGGEQVSVRPEQVRRLYTAAVTPIEGGYRPEVFDGDIVYVTPGLEDAPDGGGPAEWRAFVTGQVLERTLPSTHAAMLAPETAGALAALLFAAEQDF